MITYQPGQHNEITSLVSVTDRVPNKLPSITEFLAVFSETKMKWQFLQSLHMIRRGRWVRGDMDRHI